MWIVIGSVIALLALAGARQLYREGTGQAKARRNPRLNIVAGILTFAVASVWTFYAASKPIQLVPLPPGTVDSSGGLVHCSYRSCDRLATRIAGSAARELETNGHHVYTKGAGSGAYCDEHRPTEWESDTGGTLLAFAAAWGVLMILYKGLLSVYTFCGQASWSLQQWRWRRFSDKDGNL